MSSGAKISLFIELYVSSCGSKSYYRFRIVYFTCNDSL